MCHIPAAVVREDEKTPSMVAGCPNLRSEAVHLTLDNLLNTTASFPSRSRRQA